LRGWLGLVYKIVETPGDEATGVCGIGGAMDLANERFQQPPRFRFQRPGVGCAC
jgi:hypothetical protein